MTEEREHTTSDIPRLTRYWRDEMEAAAAYEELAAQATDERVRGLLRKMAETERSHADRWAERIRTLGGTLPAPPSRWKARWLRWAARWWGMERVLEHLEGQERAAIRGYGEDLRDPASRSLAAQARADEQQHAVALRVLSQGTSGRAEEILAREHWHRQGGGSMRDLIFGVNDGLVSTLSLVSGVAGASPGREVVLLAGFAGMVAGAISMAAGAYISTKSEREVYEAEVRKEEEELDLAPEEELEELRLLYQLKGLGEEEAARLVDRLAEDRDLLLDGLLREELGLIPEAFPNPWKAALFSGGAFLVGALPPLLPYLFLEGVPAVAVSAAVSAVALFAIGVLKTFFTRLSWLRSGLEMVGIGVLATLFTYFIGRLFGVQLS